jgi:hypothetical protein
VAKAVLVALVVNGTEHRPGANFLELRRNSHMAAVIGDRIPHNELAHHLVDEEYASVSTIEQPPVKAVVEYQGEAVGRDAAWRVKS